MNEKINLEIQYTIDDYVRGLSFIRDRQPFFKYGIYLLPFIPIGFFIFTTLAKLDGPAQMTWNLALINLMPVFLICLLLMLVQPFVKWNVKRQIKSSPLLQSPQEVSFDDQGIRGESTLSNALTKWDAVTEAVESEKDFFFYISSKNAIFVPKRAFSDEFQMNLLRGLIRTKLGEKARF